MNYIIKQPILGFESVTVAKLITKDSITSLLVTPETKEMKLTLINVSDTQKSNEIKVPLVTKTLLNLDTDYSIYCPIILNSTVDKSAINFGAPIVFNHTNNTMAQFIIDTHLLTIEELKQFNN